MRTAGVATSRDESPVFFRAGDEWLFGILTAPRVEPRGVAVVIVSGGGTPLSTNVNRLSVRLCRRVAGLGFHAFRFDYHGVGESSGGQDRFNLASPFTADLRAAIGHLRGVGLRRFVLIGSCFGARTVLTTAASVEGVEGVVLISPPVRDFEMGERVSTRLATELSVGQFVRRAARVATLKGLANARMRRTYSKVAREKLRRIASSTGVERAGDDGRYRTSGRFVEPLLALSGRGVPMFIIYGDGDDLFAEFQRARDQELADLLDAPGSTTVLAILPGGVHGFQRVEAQERVLDLVSEWVTARSLSDEDLAAPGSGAMPSEV